MVVGDCIEYQGSRNERGYGTIKVGDKCLLTHRCAYEMHYGPIPEGMLVCHSCDNPGCIKRTHLFLGTDQDNRDDCGSKGRQYVKLSDELVADIRKLVADGCKRSEVARRFGISSARITQLCGSSR